MYYNLMKTPYHPVQSSCSDQKLEKFTSSNQAPLFEKMTGGQMDTVSFCFFLFLFCVFIFILFYFFKVIVNIEFELVFFFNILSYWF